ncbi:hypothetical protein ACEU6E_02955 [Halorutilales archaeon Cl-col2-1]
MEINKNKSQLEDLGKSWSPKRVHQAALESFERNPNKRMIVHFMQPHAPYFGERAKSIRDRLQNKGYKFWAWTDEINKEERSEDDYILSHLLDAAQNGLIGENELIALYKENLNYVLGFVEELQNIINGKTIITADHGEMLGETKAFLPCNMGEWKAVLDMGVAYMLKNYVKSLG